MYRANGLHRSCNRAPKSPAGAEDSSSPILRHNRCCHCCRMKSSLILLTAVMGISALGQVNNGRQLFPTPPVTGVEPGPLTNTVRTNLHAGTNAPVFTNNSARGSAPRQTGRSSLTNGLGRPGLPPGLGSAPGMTGVQTNTAGRSTRPLPGVLPGVPPRPDRPTLPGTAPTTPGVPPALPEAPGAGVAPVPVPPPQSTPPRNTQSR